MRPQYTLVSYQRCNLLLESRLNIKTERKALSLLIAKTILMVSDHVNFTLHFQTSLLALKASFLDSIKREC